MRVNLIGSGARKVLIRFMFEFSEKIRSKKILIG